MATKKTARRIFKQYGRHIKACEKRLGSSMELMKLGFADYNHLKEMAESK